MHIKKLFNFERIANSITVLRLVLGFPLLMSLASGHILTAWTLIIIGGISDWLDGWFARKGGRGSAWGAQMDPLADKIMLLSPILWLTYKDIIPLWSVWILISREYLITAWRGKYKDGAPASRLAKVKTSLQFFCIIFLLWPLSIGGESFYIISSSLGIIFFWSSLFISLISAYNYINNRSI